MPVFEVDQRVNTERKAAVLQRVLGATPPSVRLVPVDFETEPLMPALQAAGYRQGERTFFIWEGVTQYLRPESVRSTLDQLRDAAPGSRLVFTYIRQDFVDGTDLHGAEALYRRFRQRRQVWQSGLVREDVGDLLDEYASFPEWHERLSVYATHLNQGRDLERVLVARKGRRGVWHVVDQVQLKGVVPECAKSARDDSFQGEVRWGEPTCLRCRRSAQWDSPTMGPGRRSERRRRRATATAWKCLKKESAVFDVFDRFGCFGSFSVVLGRF